MRPLKKLTFDAFRDLLATTFTQIADPRDPHRVTWELPAVLMSAFAMLSFQHPSLLEYQRRHLRLCILGDELYAREPFIQELRELRMGFVLVAKPTSHAALFEQLAERELRGKCERGAWTEGPASHRRSFAYRSAVAVPLTQSGTVRVNFVEVWERRPDGTVSYHNSWVTDFAVTPETVATLVGIGRSRWKIENEQFNVHKNHRYEVEHNYGHGQQTLSMVFYLLNLLAFLAHKLLEFGDRLYQQCRAGESCRGLWTLFRSAFYLIAVDCWDALLRYHLREIAASP